MKRNRSMLLRFSTKELETLTEKARKTNFSREEFCRRILNGATVKEAPTTDYMMLLRTLRNQYYELNEIRKLLAAGGKITPERIEADLLEFRQVITKIEEAY